MRSVEVASVVALADTMRPVLLIGFVVGLFGVAALAVGIGRWQVRAKQAKRLSEDTGSALGATRGGDGTFSTDWLEQARTTEPDTGPRQSWADVIGLQTGDVDAMAADESSPFYQQSPSGSTYATPAYPQAATIETPAAYPAYEAPAEPAYQQAPAYETAAYETPAALAYEAPPTPAYEAPAEQAYQPVADDSPFGATNADPVPPVASQYANEYASFFTTPAPGAPATPAPAVEPTNIWALDPND